MGDVKAAGVYFHLSAVNAGQVQHGFYQPGEALYLVGDNMQVFVLLAPGDGTIQNAVDEPGDGGHGGFQLVGDIGDEAAAHALGVGEGVRHVVKGRGQLAHLVLPGYGHPGGKIPGPKAVGRQGHLPQGPHHAVHKSPHQAEGRRQSRQSRQQKDFYQLPLQGVYRGGAGGREHRPHLFAVGGHGHADDVVPFRVHPVQVRAPLELAFPGCGGIGGGHFFYGVQFAVRKAAKQHLALQVCDENIRAGADGEAA